MTTESSMMATEPRELKILYLDSLEIDNFDIPGILEVSSFYPTYDTTGIFIMGRYINNYFGLFYYDTIEKQLTDIFEQYKPSDYRNLMGFAYYVE